MTKLDPSEKIFHSLEAMGKKIFAIETAPITHGTFNFDIGHKTSIQTAETDGLLFLKDSKKLKQLPAPWCYLDYPEVVFELKMRGEDPSRKNLKRAFLQRQAREFFRYDKEPGFEGNLPLCFVAAKIPEELLRYTTARALDKQKICHKATSSLFDLYFVSSNLLPLEEVLIPFLVTRDGAPLESFFRWVATKRDQDWVSLLLDVFTMPQDFVDEVMDIVAKVNDPNRLARREVITKQFFKSDPDLKAKFDQAARNEGRQEGRQEAQLEMLKNMLVLKLGRALTKKEGGFFEQELTRLGADDIGKRVMEKDKKELVAWLSPKAAAPKKPATKKAPTKKPTKKKTTH